MLINDFFKVTSLSGEAASFRALLTVNAQHRIFEGHFPGQPVVPGVCLMQMVQELTELALGNGTLRLSRADQMKFISPLDPWKVGELDMKLDLMQKENGVMQVAASLLNAGKPCFKFSGVFVRE